MADRQPQIALLTDFGTRDSYAAQVKAVISGIAPGSQITDITHEVPAYDIEAGAFLLHTSYRAFPKLSVFLAVVDPGVGGPRRPIMICTDDYYFIGPDNGIFSYIYETDFVYRTIHITADHLFREPVSRTFHARDIFAPAAAWLLRGTDSSNFGEIINDPTRLELRKPKSLGAKLMKGQVMWVDSFGTLITNLPSDGAARMAESNPGKKLQIMIGATEILVQLDGGFQGAQGAPTAYAGSSSYLEIACVRASAADTLQIGRGKEIALAIE
jgi:S-adenosylmethionine hydrolase